MTTSIALQATRRATSTICADLTESLHVLLAIKRKRQLDLTTRFAQNANASPTKLGHRTSPTSPKGRRRKEQPTTTSSKTTQASTTQASTCAVDHQQPTPPCAFQKKSWTIPNLQLPDPRTNFLLQATYICHPECSHAAARAARGLAVDHRMRLPNDSGIFEPPRVHDMHGRSS